VTRGTVAKRRRRDHDPVEPFAFVLFDENNITGLICAACATKDDDTSVGIFEKGTIVCDRCGETA
jgi:hypothetical protein